MRILTASIAIVGIAALTFAPQASAGPIIFTGSPTDWGVNLQTQLGGSYNVNNVAGTYNTIVRSSLTPTSVSGVSSFVEVTPLPEDHGGGFCDVMAIYASVDSASGYAYFGVITNSNPNGTPWDGYGNARFGPGDLKITVTQTSSADAVYGIGARPIDLATKYGLVTNGTLDRRNPASWVSGTVTDATANTAGTYFNGSAEIRKSVTGNALQWDHVDNPGPAIDAYMVANTGSQVGTASAQWNRVIGNGNAYTGNYVGYNQADPYGVPSGHTTEPYSTWIYEVAVKLSDLGITDTSNSPVLALSYFAADCGNDSLSMDPLLAEQGGILVGTNQAPEPVAMIFFGTGLVAVGGYVARRRMSRNA
jgi:hypothetical protein